MQASDSQRARFALEGTALGGGEFEILAITAGSGNGWQFSEQTLQNSLPCWDGVECFIDHAPAGRSLRDLAGMCSQPSWDATAAGVRLHLRALGPAAELLCTLGGELLATTPPLPRIGFSADVIFTAQGRTVTQVLRVLSVDLVYEPARGGAFVRAIHSLQPDSMEENLTQTTDSTPLTSGQPSAPLHDVQQILCSALLEASLQAAHLPEAAAIAIRARFNGGNFEPHELQTALEGARSLVSALTGAAVVQGPGRMRDMFDTHDQLQAAVDDLLGAPRSTELAGLHSARLSGIRELYLLLTGDYDLHGGYFPEHIRLATTADFTGLVKNSLNKVVANRWEELGRAGYNWWQRVVNVEHFSTLNQITGTLVGTVGDLPSVAEGAAYTELMIGDSPETASFTKYGGYIPLTLELIDRDETRKLRAYPQELAAAGLRKISKLVADIFTTTSGVGPSLADGGALFNTTAVTSAGGHKNLLTTALSAAEWESAASAIYNQPMLVKNASGSYGTGARMAVNPRYLLVPRALQLTGMKILYPSLENAVNIYSENQQRGQPGDVITVPEWTDASDWAAVCDPRIVPGIFVGERFGLLPEIFIAGDPTSPAVFSNDEHRLKVRHFMAVWVNDFRPLHKSNVV